jgi:hypothetical protein
MNKVLRRRICPIVEKLTMHTGCTTNQIQITSSTFLSICIQLGVTMNFLDGVLKPSIWSKQSGGSFHNYDADGEVEAISRYLSLADFITVLTIQDGFYHYFNEWHLGSLHTWFSYNVKSKCTTYLLFDCPQNVKEKLTAGDFLPQALGVDLLIAEECALWREVFSDEKYKQIFNWVRALRS